MPNNNKQSCSCQTCLRNLLFQLVQRVSLHFKSPYLYSFCTKKVFPKFLLPFESQASFQSEEFSSYDYAPRSLSLIACSLSSLRAHAHAKTILTCFRYQASIQSINLVSTEIPAYHRIDGILPTSSPGSSRFPIWRRQERRPWHTAN